MLRLPHRRRSNISAATRLDGLKMRFPAKTGCLAWNGVRARYVSVGMSVLWAPNSPWNKCKQSATS